MIWFKIIRLPGRQNMVFLDPRPLHDRKRFPPLPRRNIRIREPSQNGEWKE